MEQRLKLYDDVAWSYEYTLKTYMKTNRKSMGELTEADKAEIYEWAGIHIAFFITWLVNNDFQSDYFSSDSIQQLKSEEITGIEFLKEYCDGKLVSDMIKDDVIPFVSNIYNERYFNNHYAKWVMTVLNDLPLEFGWNWDDCHEYEKYLTTIYLEPKESTDK